MISKFEVRCQRGVWDQPHVDLNANATRYIRDNLCWYCPILPDGYDVCASVAGENHRFRCGFISVISDAQVRLYDEVEDIQSTLELRVVSTILSFDMPTRTMILKNTSGHKEGCGRHTGRAHRGRNCTTKGVREKR